MKQATVATCILAGFLALGALGEAGPRAEQPGAVPKPAKAAPPGFRITNTIQFSETNTVREEILFVGKYAVVLADNPAQLDTVFDLEGLSWHDERGGAVKLEQAEAWARMMADKMRERLATLTDEQSKEFIQALLTPSFEVTETPKQLVFRNKFMRYTVSTAPLEAGKARRFFAFDRLSTYQKAMQPGQLPPYPPLAVTAALEARSVLPKSIEFAVTTEQGTQTYTSQYSLDSMAKSAVLELQQRLRAKGFSD